MANPSGSLPEFIANIGYKGFRAIGVLAGLVAGKGFLFS
jgi:hypothetical protein